MVGENAIVVVRHARAGHKLVDDPVRDVRRHLDTAGRSCANTLPDAVLERVLPTGLVSSPLVRCTETLAPLAARIGVRVRTHPALLPDASLRQAAALLTAIPEHTVACTHGEVISRLFGGLHCEKGAFLIVERDAGRLHPVRYVPPHAPLRRAHLAGIGMPPGR